jgi:hypothetical protein
LPKGEKWVEYDPTIGKDNIKGIFPFLTFPSIS